MHCAMNRFCTGQGLCASALHNQGLVSSDKCGCGQIRTMSHITNECPNTRLLQRLFTNMPLIGNDSTRKMNEEMLICLLYYAGNHSSPVSKDNQLV